VRGLPQLAGVHSDLFESLRNIYKKFLYGRCPLDQRNGESDQPRCKSGGILIKDAFEKLGLSE
jgi:hypothetical protein